MDTNVPGGEEGGTCTRWSTIRMMWANLAVLGLVLFIGVFVVDNGNIAVPDEGVYAAQVDLLSHGSWDAPRTSAVIDPEGTRTVVRAEFVDGDRYIPYTRHPAFTALMVPFYRLGGYGGMLMASALGTWAAALAAALIARRLNPSYGVPTLWLVGLGCPLFFDAYLVAGHSVGAALCGFAVLGVSQALDDRRYWSLAYALPAAALLVNIRSEGVIAMGVLGGIVGLFALAGVFWRRVDWHAGFVGAALLVVTGSAYLLDSWLTRRVIGAGGFGGQPLERVLGDKTGPISAAWSSLLRPYFADGSQLNTALILSVSSLLFASVAVKLLPRLQLLPVALVALSAAAAVWHLFAPLELITGLFAAFPLLLGGILLVSWQDLKVPLVRRLLAFGVVTTGFLLLTIYDIGGAVEWGGRFFHVLLPALIPLVVLGLAHAARCIPERPAWLAKAAATAVMVTTVAITVPGLRINFIARRDHAQAVDATMDFARAHSTEKKPVVIVAMLTIDGTGRMFWKHINEAKLVSSFDVQDMIELVHRTDVEFHQQSVTAVSNVGPQLMKAASARLLERYGWKLKDHARAGHSAYFLYEFVPDG